MAAQHVQPIFILPEDTQRTTGRDAQRMNIMAAKSVAQTVRTTLRTIGMYIMIADRIGVVTAAESELIEGIVLDKERVHSSMPRNVLNAKVALLDAALEIKNTEIDAKIQISDPSQIEGFLEQEEKHLRKMVAQVQATGATTLFCQKGIDDMAQHFLAKAGIFASRRVSKDDMEKLSRATGANIVSNLNDLSKDDLGFAGVVREERIGDEEMVFVEKCKNPKAVTILVRGGTDHVVDEVKRALTDAVGDVIAAIKVG